MGVSLTQLAIWTGGSGVESALDRPACYVAYCGYTVVAVAAVAQNEIKGESAK